MMTQAMPFPVYPLKCSVCGARRIIRPNGTHGACSALECKDPTLDVWREHGHSPGLDAACRERNAHLAARTHAAPVAPAPRRLTRACAVALLRASTKAAAAPAGCLVCFPGGEAVRLVLEGECPHTERVARRVRLTIGARREILEWRCVACGDVKTQDPAPEGLADILDRWSKS